MVLKVAASMTGSPGGARRDCQGAVSLFAPYNQIVSLFG